MRSHPNESIFVEICNPSEDFSLEQVLIGDAKVGWTMRLMADFKRDPKNWLWLCGVLLSVLLSVATLAWTHAKIESASKENEESVRINKRVRSTLEKLSVEDGAKICTPYLYSHKPGDEGEFERKIRQSERFANTVLHLNHATSLDELRLRDELILCKAIQPQSPND